MARTSLRKTEGPELKSLRARLGYADGGAADLRKPVDLGDLDLANLDIDTETEDEADSGDISRSDSQVFERVGRKAAVKMKEVEKKPPPDVVHEGVDDDDDDDHEDDEIERSLRYRAYKNQITKEKVPHKVIFTRQFSSTSTASTAARTGSPSPATTTASSSSSASTSRASSRASSVRQRNPSQPPQSYQLNQRQMHATLHSEFIQSDRWAEALQTLDLTLDEVIHIRSVLTKAEMESLPLDGSLKEDVE